MMSITINENEMSRTFCQICGTGTATDCPGFPRSLTTQSKVRTEIADSF